MFLDIFSTAVRVGVVTTGEIAHIVVDNTVGRLLDTNPDKVR